MALASPRIAWTAALALAAGSRLWNALESRVLQGYDAWGHVSYALFLDLYRAVPYADQGWSYFHPPLHYALGFLLAQAGDAELLVRGLALVGSAASLGTAGLAAWLVRRAVPARPLWAPLAFVAVAFLPVEIYTSPMPGNEQTAALLASLGIALFARNQLRQQPTRRGDLAAGAVLGLALLAKFSGLLPLLAVDAVLAVEALRAGSAPARWRAAGRAALLTGVALLLAAPYYARNLVAFGTPFQLSRDTPLVARVESEQPPQQRGWLDLVQISPRTLLEPGVREPHLLHSIWGSLYVHVWSDQRAELFPSWSQLLPIWMGLVPTGLALLGLPLAARRALGRRAAPLDGLMLALTLVNLGAFALMAYRVPTWAMLKASYLLQLSLPFALFLARALEALERRGGRWLTQGAALWLVLTAAVAGLAHTPGVALPRGGENPPMAATHLYFGSYGRTARIAAKHLALARGARRAWLSELAGAALLGVGDWEQARRLYQLARDEPSAPWVQIEERSSPWVTNRLAVATALAGDRAAARALLDERLASETLPELLVNRGALLALAGDLSGAEADLDAALRLDPTLAAAWHNLAWLRERRGDPREAAMARREADVFARTPPRGYPYGIGDGFHLGGQRPLLMLEGAGLALYRPARAWPRS